MEHNDKIKKAFWITEDMDREIDAHLKQDNCSSRSEFVMNALKFYVGYLNTKNASAFLPEVLSATLTGTLDGFAGRIGSLLFKQGVDINLMAQIIAYDTDIDEGAYERLRPAPPDGSTATPRPRCGHRPRSPEVRRCSRSWRRGRNGPPAILSPARSS